VFVLFVTWYSLSSLRIFYHYEASGRWYQSVGLDLVPRIFPENWNLLSTFGPYCGSSRLGSVKKKLKICSGMVKVLLMLFKSANTWNRDFLCCVAEFYVLQILKGFSISLLVLSNGLIARWWKKVFCQVSEKTVFADPNVIDYALEICTLLMSSRIASICYLRDFYLHMFKEGRTNPWYDMALRREKSGDGIQAGSWR